MFAASVRLQQKAVQPVLDAFAFEAAAAAAATSVVAVAVAVTAATFGNLAGGT